MGFRSEKYGLFRGRFQPFHKGHIEKCKYILSHHQILVLGLVIIKPNLSLIELNESLKLSVKLSIIESFHLKNNPFSFTDTYNIIIGSLIEEGVDLKRIMIIPHFTPIVYPSEMEFLFTPPQNETVLYIVPKGEHNIYGIEYYATRGWKIEVPPESKLNISGTEIRQRVRDNQNVSGWITQFAIEYIKIKEKENENLWRSNT